MAVREPTFQSVDVQPPTFQPVTLDEDLVVSVWNSVSGIKLTLMGRILRPDGSIALIQESMVPSTDRSLSDYVFNLPPGYLINLAVGSDQNPRRGECYVQMNLRRGGMNMHLLAADYVTATRQYVSWPAGRIVKSTEGPGVIRAISGTDPAANTDASDTVPTNARWRLLAYRIALTTDANVADRRVSMNIETDSLLVAQVFSRITQPANTTYVYQFNVGLEKQTSLLDTTVEIALPDNLLLFQGWEIRMGVANRQVGDDFSGPQIFVEEWIED